VVRRWDLGTGRLVGVPLRLQPAGAVLLSQQR
jgi:hypothetical protein